MPSHNTRAERRFDPQSNLTPKDLFIDRKGHIFLSHTSDRNQKCLFVDGACRNNGTSDARAAVGVYFKEGSPYNLGKAISSVGIPTNNYAEISAAKCAIDIVRDLATSKDVDIGTTLVLVTDSSYLVNCMTQWISKWETNKWTTSTGGHVANKETLQQLDEALYGMYRDHGVAVKFWLVLRDQNCDADRLANEGLMSTKAKPNALDPLTGVHTIGGLWTFEDPLEPLGNMNLKIGGLTGSFTFSNISSASGISLRFVRLAGYLDKVRPYKKGIDTATITSPYGFPGATEPVGFVVMPVEVDGVALNCSFWILPELLEQVDGVVGLDFAAKHRLISDFGRWPFVFRRQT